MEHKRKQSFDSSKWILCTGFMLPYQISCEILCRPFFQPVHDLTFSYLDAHMKGNSTVISVVAPT